MQFNPREILHEKRELLHQRYVRGWKSLVLFEFLTFGIKQAWACLFGALMLAILLGTHLLYPQDWILPRYDTITILAIAIQIALLWCRLETLEEARIILIFHVVGTVMEIFKTKVGSWTYPEPSYLNLFGVPMFSGFMYASVGSYIARVWRIFDFQFERFPKLAWQAVLAVCVYINFFSHHYVADFRWMLFVGAAILYGPTTIAFKADETHRKMPLLLGLLLVAVFIWFAENIGTFARAWTYPTQQAGWHIVSFSKLGSWFLLMLISFVLVAWAHRPKMPQTERNT